jgi:hypothetical protein
VVSSGILEDMFLYCVYQPIMGSLSNLPTLFS